MKMVYTIVLLMVALCASGVNAEGVGDHELCLKNEIRLSPEWERGIKPGAYRHVSGDWRRSFYDVEGAGTSRSGDFTVTKIRVSWSKSDPYLCVYSKEYRPFCGQYDPASLKKC